MSGRPRRGWALCLLALALLAGCSSRPDRAGGGGGEPPLPAMLTITDTATLSLPLDPFRLGTRTLPLSARASDVLVNRCLARFGFAPLPPTPVVPTTAGPSARRYGVTDLALARVRGYHGPAAAPVAERRRPELSPAAQAVLSGTGQASYSGQQVPQGGCLGEAERRLRTGAPTVPNMSLGEDLSAETYGRSAEDSRVRGAFTAWSGCMKALGYDYVSPVTAIDDPAFVATEAPTDRERAVAVADIGCKRKVNLIAIWATVETAYQRGALDRNAEALDTLRKSFRVQEKNAAAILARG